MILPERVFGSSAEKMMSSGRASEPKANSRPEFVYRHAWRAGDPVIWDNRATMHRARPCDDTKVRRELRRATTLDIEPPAPVTTGP